MNFSSTLFTIFEMALAALAIWAVFHEDRFIVFEEKLAARFRRRKFKVLEGNSVNKSYYPVNNR